MKKNISNSAFAVLLISLMLLSSFTLTSLNLTHAQGSNLIFSSGETIDFTSTTTMTFQPDSMTIKFGTGIEMEFEDVTPDGVLMPCDYIRVLKPIGYIPPQCSWWEVFDPITMKPLSATGS